MPINEATVDELEPAITAGARLIDVREHDEYTAGHVPGAVLVPLSTVPDQLDLFRSDGPTYVICKSGGRSMRACEAAADQGIEVVNVEGGTTAWVLSGRDVVEGERPA